MSKESKVEYERVDEKDDTYKRILVKFNPSFGSGSEFEIEFIPYLDGVENGRVFVTEIDSMSSIYLYRWALRHLSLTTGIGSWERGYIPSIKENKEHAEGQVKVWRAGKSTAKPRQIISRVKRVYEAVAENFSEPTTFAYNQFLLSGQLASLPVSGEAFKIEDLKYVVEEGPYNCKNSSGEWVERPLAEHLFDVHKTKYVAGAILNFLEKMRELRIAFEETEEEEQ